MEKKTIYADMCGSVMLGRQGENAVTEVAFACPEDLIGENWLLSHRRSTDKQAYPVSLTARGGYLIWDINTADTAIAGRGQAELTCYGAGGEVLKSTIYTTNVIKSLDAGGEVPDPVEPWYESIVERLDQAENGVVKSVNGVSPDESGNVEIETVTEEELAAAVESYMEENPVEGGATEEQAKQIAENTEAIAENKESITNNTDGIESLQKKVARETVAIPNFTQSNYAGESTSDFYYADGLWVSCDSYKGLYYSADGKTWTQSNITSANIYRVYYADGLWVAGGSSGLYYSADGKTWTQSNIAKYTLRVYYADGLWVAGGSSGLYYSADGKTWTQSNITSGKITVVYYADGIWVAGGSSGLYYSADGKTWVQSNITSANIYRVYYADGLWVACSGDYAGIYYSTDGKTWVQSNITSGCFDDVYYADGIWVAGGYYSEYYVKNTTGIYYSTDGKTWVQSNITSGDIYRVYYADGLWVAGGSSGLYYSADGKTWTQSNITSGKITVVYYADGIWVAGGSSGLYYSTQEIAYLSDLPTDYVKTVNGSEPDESGNVEVEIPSGYVKSVNGVSPDENGNVEVEASAEIPETLPNPNALTFTGAVEATYDGSTPVSVEIPAGGGSGGDWELIGEVVADGTADAYGIYIPVDFTQYREIHAEAVTVVDTTVTYRIVAGVKGNTSWWSGVVLYSAVRTEALMFSVHIINILGELKVLAGHQSGFSGGSGIAITNSSRVELSESLFDAIRLDTNNNSDLPTPPEGCTLKVWGVKK